MADAKFWNDLNMSMMHHGPMHMNALESLKDEKMIYLDLLSGVLAEILMKFLIPEHKFNPLNIGLVLASRSIVDFLYYHIVSKTNAFGGTLLELGLSIPVFVLLFKTVNPNFSGSLMKVGVVQIIVLFAMARVTGWA
jgi:hypothetical protein